MEAVALRAGRRMLSKNAQGYEAADPVYEVRGIVILGGCHRLGKVLTVR